MSKRREALDQMRSQIREDTKMPFWIPFLSAILAAVMALIFSTKEGYLFAVTAFLVLMTVSTVGGLAMAITKIYLKPIVELWLAAEGESAVEEEKYGVACAPFVCLDPVVAKRPLGGFV